MVAGAPGLERRCDFLFQKQYLVVCSAEQIRRQLTEAWTLAEPEMRGWRFRASTPTFSRTISLRAPDIAVWHVIRRNVGTPWHGEGRASCCIASREPLMFDRSMMPRRTAVSSKRARTSDCLPSGRARARRRCPSCRTAAGVRGVAEVNLAWGAHVRRSSTPLAAPRQTCSCAGGRKGSE